MQQSGFLLPTVFIFLLVLTLWGFNALTTAQLQMRMSANWSESAQQLAAAEVGLQQAEYALQDLAAVSCFYTTPVVYTPNHYPEAKIAVCSVTDLPITTRYVIEQLPNEGCVLTSNHPYLQGNFYLITAWSQTNSSVATVVQSTYLKANSHICLPDKNKIVLIPGRLSWRQLS